MRRATEPALDKVLDVLRDHLQLIEMYGQFMVDGPGRFRIADNSTLYQINVHPELFDGSDHRRDGPGRRKLQPPMLRRLQKLEGVLLERMTAECLLHLPDVTWSRQGVWRIRT